MPRSRFRTLVLAAAGCGLVGAGTAAAYLTFWHRDVTTSSAEAYRWYLRGRENDQKLYSREAIQAYAEALRLDCHFVMATVRLAANLYERDPERARSLTECAARYRDEVTPRERLLLKLQEARLARDEAGVEAAIGEYVQRFPNDPEGHEQRAGLLLKKGKPDDAVAEYERVLAIDPNHAIAYNSIGYYWASRGDYLKAEDYFRRYRFLAPDQANPYDSIGELYANIGRYEEAEENLKKALAIKPDFFQSVGHLAVVHFGRGEYADAALAYRKAGDMTENSAGRIDFGFCAALAFLEAGEKDRALKELERMRTDLLGVPAGKERDRLETWVARNEATIEAFTGNLEAADRAFERAKTLASALPADSTGDRKRSFAATEGILHAARGRHEEAVTAFRTALDVTNRPDGFGYYPGEARVRVALAESLRTLGREDEAREALAPILGRNPKFQLALLESHKLGQPEGAGPEAALRTR